MSILFQQDFDNIHVSFYRNMKSHVVEKMIISRVMRGICSDYYKDCGTWFIKPSGKYSFS